MNRSDDERLVDIRAAIGRCRDYRGQLDSADFGSMAYDAVLRNLAVIGEAVKTLPKDLKRRSPDTPLASIAGLRNVVVHEYFRVNPDLIRDILDQHLPALDDAISVIIDQGAQPRD